MLNIGPHDLVLEIGSGNRPRARSNILVDRYPADSTERAGGEPVVVDSRPFVVADGLALPFKDKSFDYVIASHILEHVSDPIRFADELARVARAGYIETPSELAEKMFGWSFHRWIVRVEGGKIIMRPRTLPSPFGDYFHQQFASDLFFAEFINSHRIDFFVHYEWCDSIHIQLEDDTSPHVKMNTGMQYVETRTPADRIALTLLRYAARPILKLMRHFWKFR